MTADNTLPTESFASPNFSSLGLLEPLVRAVSAAGYTEPTPIQAQAIPPALAGRDVLGLAQTGTGKTAAFVLPMLQHLMGQREPQGNRRPRALVLAPTRELVSQILASFHRYGAHAALRYAAIYGGVSALPQIQAMRNGVDVLVATPGRLWDLAKQRRADLGGIEILVLDEVDRMVDQGFWPTVRQIVEAVPKKRQTSLFSATMPDVLRTFLPRLLVDPVRISVSPNSSTPDRIEQRVWFVGTQADKRARILDLVERQDMARAVVFTRTKHGANRLAESLAKAGIRADAIHGNKSQNARERALSSFRSGRLAVLVATDVAARGLDIDGISHVVNYDLPMDPENYVHRIGRTARAGRAGAAFSLCSDEERPLLARIERLIGNRVPVAAP